MGVWRRSALGRLMARTDTTLLRDYDRALPGWSMRDVVGSPFSVQAYEPDERMGGFDGARCGPRRIASPAHRARPRLRHQSHQPRPRLDSQPPRALRRRHARQLSAIARPLSAGRVRRFGPLRRLRSRPELSSVAGRRAVELLQSGDARSHGWRPSIDRAPLRRRSLRHGDARAQRDLRRHLEPDARPSVARAVGRVLARRHRVACPA